MKVLSISLSSHSRSTLAVSVGIIAISCVLGAVVLDVIGIYIFFSSTSSLFIKELVPVYNYETLSLYLIIFGSASLLLNLFGASLAQASLTPGLSRFVKIGQRTIVVYHCLTFVTTILIFGGCWYCHVQVALIDDSLNKGLSSAMDKYRFEKRVKISLDNLQMQKQCCGNNAYSDWLYKDWFDSRYTKNVAKYQDSVPFSCCNPGATRPCIHQYIHENSEHPSYDCLTDMTLHMRGCRKVVVDYYKHAIFVPLGYTIFSIGVLNLVNLLLSQYLQTATFDYLLKEKENTTGYLFRFKLCHYG